MPTKTGFKEVDLDIAIYGMTFNREIFDRLANEGDILRRIAPPTIKEKFLKSSDFVETKAIYETSLRTRGDARFASRDVLIEGIREGVAAGLFGLGEVEEGQPSPDTSKRVPRFPSRRMRR